MTLTCTDFTCFAEVEAHYNSIKPYRGKLSVYDIRPIGDRRRRWERIKKINADCYALMDGFYGGDDVFGPGGVLNPRDGMSQPTLKQVVMLAPIVWFRHPDGSESVKLRNGVGRGSHTSRYAFLTRHTPARLRFVNMNGKHYIRNQDPPVTDIFLAKGRTILKGQYAYGNPKSTYEDDGVALTFFATEPRGAWVFKDNGKPIPVAPRQIVDRAEKDKYKDAIKEFRVWGLTMLPLLPMQDYKYRLTMMREFLFALPSGVFGGVPFEPSELVRGEFSYHSNKPSAQGLRRILEDNNHPLRLHLLVYCLSKIEFAEEYTESAKSAARIKTTFTRIINRVFEFNTEV